MSASRSKLIRVFVVGGSMAMAWTNPVAADQAATAFVSDRQTQDPPHCLKLSKKPEAEVDGLHPKMGAACKAIESAFWHCQVSTPPVITSAAEPNSIHKPTSYHYSSGRAVDIRGKNLSRKHLECVVIEANKSLSFDPHYRVLLEFKGEFVSGTHIHLQWSGSGPRTGTG